MTLWGARKSPRWPHHKWKMQLISVSGVRLSKSAKLARWESGPSTRPLTPARNPLNSNLTSRTIKIVSTQTNFRMWLKIPLNKMCHLIRQIQVQTGQMLIKKILLLSKKTIVWTAPRFQERFNHWRIDVENSKQKTKITRLRRIRLIETNSLYQNRNLPNWWPNLLKIV